LRRVARYLDPGVPDQERALARRGVTLVGSIKSGALVEVLARAGPLAETAASVRAFTRRAVADSVGTWSPRAAAIVAAILIGDRTGLDESVERRLQEAGTYHVIAISGGNIAILAALTVAAFRVVGMLGRAAMLSAAGALAAYGYIVSGSASVTRAVLMAVIYFVARAWDLRGPPMQILLLTAAVLVVVDPLSVADTGALLTFGATAGLIATSRVVPLDRVPGLVRPALSLLLATIAAEAALLPVAATVFSRITFAGLLLNFAAIPLMAVAQLAGMAIVPLYAVSVRLARLVAWAAYVGAEGLVRSADLVALAPWSTWRVAPPSPWLIASYYACLVVTIGCWRPPRHTTPPVAGGRRYLLRAAAIGLAVSALWLVAPPDLSAHGDGRLHVTFIDVGQGDAALVRLPHGTAILIDAGGLASGATFDIGDRIVGPVLRHEGVRRLASLVLTHGDADHVGGALSVLRDFRPWDVWDGVPVPPSLPMQRLRQEALAMNTRWTTVQRMDRVVFDEVEFAVKHPPPPDWERQDVRNEDSIVLELRWRDVSFVFTGDIGREAEAQLSGQFAPAALRVVKVPHHGSATSSSEEFVHALAPDVAVISAGRSNNFGHPSPVVLNRYREEGAAIFRTDHDGAVSIDTDGTSLHVSSYTGRVLRVASRSHHHEDANDTKDSEPRRHEGPKKMNAGIAKRQSSDAR
jgi:competence protein ComEC